MVQPGIVLSAKFRNKTGEGFYDFRINFRVYSLPGDVLDSLNLDHLLPFPSNFGYQISSLGDTPDFSFRAISSQSEGQIVTEGGTTLNVRCVSMTVPASAGSGDVLSLHLQGGRFGGVGSVSFTPDINNLSCDAPPPPIPENTVISGLSVSEAANNTNLTALEAEMLHQARVTARENRCDDE